MCLHVAIVCQGYRSEMDNPALSGLLPPILRSKRDILFGNMPEIYNFHSRQAVEFELCLKISKTLLRGRRRLLIPQWGNLLNYSSKHL